jgi:hypothetical protein
MELLSVLRVLLRHGRLLAAGAVVAALAGLALAGWLPIAGDRSTGAAQARVLIDTARPLAADAVAQRVDTIGIRTALLAELMAGDRMRTVMTRAAGLRDDELTVVVPSMGSPQIATPMPDRAASAAVSRRTAEVLTVTSDPAVPIITLRAAAPDAATAGRLVRAGATALGAASGAPHGPNGLVARPLGPARITTVVSGGRSRGRLAAAAAVLLLAGWCGAVVLADGAARLRRRLGVETVAGAG